MKKSNSWPENDAASRAGSALLVACLSIVLLMTAGCSSKDNNESAPPQTQQAASDGFLSTMTALLSDGQLTLNNPWTRADLDNEQIIESIGYQQTVNSHPAGRVRPYTTLVQQYRAKRKQCERDANVPNTEDEPSCYPKNVGAIVAFNGRYGYYCGAGFPPISPFASKAPEPLDGVDYCCRLHDERVWSKAGYSPLTSDQCGIVMCLSMASGSANVMAQMPDVEEARQYWYTGASSVCPGSRGGGGSPPPPALPPILGP